MMERDVLHKALMFRKYGTGHPYLAVEIDAQDKTVLIGNPFLCMTNPQEVYSLLDDLRAAPKREDAFECLREAISAYFCSGCKQGYDAGLNHGYAIAHQETTLNEEQIFERGRVLGNQEGRAEMRRNIMNAVRAKND